MPQFVIVKYLEDGAADIISSEWLLGRQKCQIPCQDAEDLMITHTKPITRPEITWEQYPIRIISRKDTLVLARQRLAKVKSDSDGETTDYVKGRKRGPPERLIELKRPRGSQQPVSVAGSSSDSNANEDTLPLPFALCQISPNPESTPPSTTAETSTSHGPLDEIKGQIKRIEERMAASERKFLTLLTSIKQTVEDTDRRIAHLSVARGIRLNMPVGLPMNTYEDVEAIDDWIKEEQNKVDLVKSLSLVGGTTTTDIARRVFWKLFSPTLALKYSLAGRSSDKRSLRGTCVYRIILDAARMSGSAGTDKDIDNCLSEVLKHAKDSVNPRPHARKEKL